MECENCKFLREALLWLVEHEGRITFSNDEEKSSVLVVARDEGQVIDSFSYLRCGEHEDIVGDYLSAFRQIMYYD